MLQHACDYFEPLLDVWFENVKAGRATICDYINWYIWGGVLLNINHAINFYLYCLVGSNFAGSSKCGLCCPKIVIISYVHNEHIAINA